MSKKETFFVFCDAGHEPAAVVTSSAARSREWLEFGLREVDPFQSEAARRRWFYARQVSQ